MTTNLPILSLHQTAIAIAACARAGRVPLVLGAPGVAKTSLCRAVAPMVARAMGFGVDDAYPAVDCILSNREAVDIGGYPVTLSDDTVEQKLFGTLRHATDWPGLLILDEFLTCSQSVQGPALRLVLERYAGEIALHEHTRIVCVANPPDQAPGGIQLTAALVNRLVILECQPQVEEVAAYFCNEPESNLVTDIVLPDDEEWARRRDEYMSVAGILFRVRPDLLCFKPPQASISDGESFASPRAWQICCEVLAALPKAHVDAVSDVVRAIVIGTLGPGTGLAYLGTLRARNYLPTIKEVIERPDTAKLPDESIAIPDPDDPLKKKRIGRDVTFAAIPLVIEAARVDCMAAWVYVDRLPDEIQAAVAKTLCGQFKSPANSPWRVKGGQILLKVTDRLTAPTVSVSASATKRKGSS